MSRSLHASSRSVRTAPDCACPRAQQVSNARDHQKLLRPHHDPARCARGRAHSITSTIRNPPITELSPPKGLDGVVGDWGIGAMRRSLHASSRSVRAASECARPRAQQASNARDHQKLLKRRHNSTSLRPRTGALRNIHHPQSTNHGGCSEGAGGSWRVVEGPGG